MDAIAGVLKDKRVGWAGALLYNRKTKHLLDGHGRLKVIDPEEYVPVLVGSWSDVAERRILLTLDPIANMATPDADALNRLMDDTDLDTASLAGLGDHLLDSIDALNVPTDQPETSVAEEIPVAVGKKAQRLQAGEDDDGRVQFIVIAECDSAEHLAALQAELASDGYACKPI